METNCYKDKKGVPTVLLALDEYLAQAEADLDTRSDNSNIHLKRLLTCVNELAKRGTALRAAVEEILESPTDSDIIAFDKLDAAAEVYDGKGD